MLSGFNSSLQEFAGEGVFFFDTHDPLSLDAAYSRMIAARPVVIDREMLRDRFCWDALAQKVVSLCA